MNELNFLFDGNFLVAEIKDTQAVIKYQLEMLTHTDINYLLPVKKQMQNNCLYLYYEISGKTALNRLVMHKKMPDSSYIEFVKGALSAVNELGEYQLSASGLILQNNYIFVNPTEYKPAFVYLPIYDDDNGLSKVVAYLKNMLVSDTVEITNSGVMQQTISILNSGGTAYDMLTQIERISGHGLGAGANNVNSGRVNVAAQPQLSSMPLVNEPAKPTETPHQTIAPAREVKPVPQPAKSEIMGGNIPVNKLHNEAKKQDIKKSGREKAKNESDQSVCGAPDMKRIIPVLLGVAVTIVIVFAALTSTGSFNDEDGNIDYSTFVAVPILIFVADYFIYNNLKNKYVIADVTQAPASVADKSKNKKNIYNKKSKEVFVPITEVKNDAYAQQPFNAKPSSSSSPMQNAVPTVVQQTQTAFRDMQSVSVRQQQFNQNQGFEDFGKTEILSDNDVANPYLKNNMGNVINIAGQITRLGKLSDQVDYVIVNPKVSRVHADIIMRDGKMYVMDLGSANGTYINGDPTRITSNMEYELHNNDRVVFANEEYTVHF